MYRKLYSIYFSLIVSSGWLDFGLHENAKSFWMILWELGYLMIFFGWGGGRLFKRISVSRLIFSSIEVCLVQSICVTPRFLCLISVLCEYILIWYMTNNVNNMLCFVDILCNTKRNCCYGYHRSRLPFLTFCELY